MVNETSEKQSQPSAEVEPANQTDRVGKSTFPTYDSLFNSESYYTVEPSRSVLSPAAYFVDLMYTQNKQIQVDEDISTTSLQARRPDLWDITLDAKNTDTLVPKLEIVNKLLQNKLEGNNLSRTIFPFNLPYNQPLAEIRKYLAQNKTSLQQLWQLLVSSKNEVTTGAIARETLGLSPEQWQIYIDPVNTDSASLAKSYGLPATAGTNPVSLLTPVSSFLKQTGLNQDQLQELLFEDLSSAEIAAGKQKQFFINSGATPITINKGQLQNLTEANLERIQRFIRLAQAINWSFTYLDWALHTIGSIVNSANQNMPVINDSSLPYLAWMQEMQSEQSLSISGSCALIGELRNIGEKEGPSFFSETFKNLNNLTPPPSWPFTTTELTSSEKQIQTALCSALQINQDNLSAMAKLFSTAISLSPDNLAILYRLSLLPKLTGMNFKDSLLAATLSGIKSSDLTSTSGSQVISCLKSLIQFSTWLKTSPFSLYQLQFILTGSSDDLSIQDKVLGETSIHNFILDLCTSMNKDFLTPANFFQSIKTVLQTQLANFFNNELEEQKKTLAGLSSKSLERVNISKKINLLAEAISSLQEQTQTLSNNIYAALQPKYIDSKGIILAANIQEILDTLLSTAITKLLTGIYNPPAATGTTIVVTTTAEEMPLSNIAEDIVATFNNYYQLQQKIYIQKLASLYQVSSPMGKLLAKQGDVTLGSLVATLKPVPASFLHVFFQCSAEADNAKKSIKTVTTILQKLQQFAELMRELSFSVREASYFQRDNQPATNFLVSLHYIQTLCQFRELVQTFGDTQNQLLNILQAPQSFGVFKDNCKNLVRLTGWNAAQTTCFCNNTKENPFIFTVASITLLQQYFTLANHLNINLEELKQLVNLPEQEVALINTFANTNADEADNLVTGLSANEITSFSNPINFNGARYIAYLNQDGAFYYAELSILDGNCVISNPILINIPENTDKKWRAGIGLAYEGDTLYITVLQGTSIAVGTIFPENKILSTDDYFAPSLDYSPASCSFSGNGPVFMYVNSYLHLCGGCYTSASGITSFASRHNCITGPALAKFKDQIYLAWGDTENAIGLGTLTRTTSISLNTMHYLSSDDTITAKCSPSLMEHNGCLWMAWINSNGKLCAGIVVNAAGTILSAVQNKVEFSVSANSSPQFIEEGILYSSSTDNAVHLLSYQPANDTFYSEKANALLSGLQAQANGESTALTTMQNQLSETFRDKLVSLAMQQMDMTNPRELYDHFLIDVEVSAVVQTSLIREAISAVQLYIYRCLNSLEPTATLQTNAPSLKDLWTWMYSYREWQANRQVFIYPENYIQPELRTNKTDLFVQLENGLKQLDFTDPESVTGVFEQYMNRFIEVNELKIVGCASVDQTVNGLAIKKICFIGQTEQQPHNYYYRIAIFNQSASNEYQPTSDWGQWQKINIQPQPVTNYEGHLEIAPIFAFGRWYLFWLEEKLAGKEKYKVILQYSYLDCAQAWVSTQTLSSADTPDAISQFGDYKDLSFSATTNTNTLSVSFAALNSNPGTTAPTLISGNIVKNIPVLSSGEKAGSPSITRNSSGQESMSLQNSSTTYPLNNTGVSQLGALFGKTDGVDLLLSTVTQETLYNNSDSQGNPFSHNSATSVYFWELFFHVPFLIANELQVNQQFAAAKRWYDYVFNPTDQQDGTFWRFLGLQTAHNSHLKEELKQPAATTLFQDVTDSTALSEYETTPFDPQAIANSRPIAYQKTMVMHYIKNLLEWGDNLFRENTRESILEAEMFYVMAYDFLGQEPQNLGPISLPNSTNYRDVSTKLFLDKVGDKAIDRQKWDAVAPLAGCEITCTLSVGNITYVGANNGLWYCTEQGDWKKADIDGDHVTCIHSYNDNIYVGTLDGYIWYSKKPGAWTKSASLGDGPVHEIQAGADFTENEGNALYARLAGIRGMGMYGGNNNNNNWETPEPIDYQAFNGLTGESHAETNTLSNVALMSTGSEGSIALYIATTGTSPLVLEYAPTMLDWSPVNYGGCPVNCMAFFGQSGALYIGTSDAGLVSGNGSRITSLPSQITQIKQLFKDEDTLYVLGNSGAASNNELFSLKQGQSALELKENFNLPESLVISCLCSIGGILYIGTEKKGLWRFTREKIWEQIPLGGTNDCTITCLCSNQVSLYAGTKEKGLWAVPLKAPATTAYFAIPRNQQFLNYWNQVKESLYDIRNGLNIKGQRDRLPLFQPPLNPMQLIENRASGEGAEQTLTPQNNTIPYYRFDVMLQKARMVTQSVIQLGQSLLSALEQKDAEKLAMLYINNRQELLNLSRTSNQDQLNAAEQSIQVLQASLVSAKNRQSHYAGLISTGLSSYERQQIHLDIAALTFLSASVPFQVGAIAGYLLPNIYGLSDGGMEFGQAIEQEANISQTTANILSTSSGLVGTKAGYQRRAQDWQLQETLAQDDINQIQQQMVVAQYHQRLAQQEIDILEENVSQEKKIADFYQKKFTNVQLYQWYIGQLSTLYFQAYQLAYDSSLQAENAWKFEHIGRGNAGSVNSFIAPGYWNSLYQGLLAGESLQLGLNRMEKSFTDQNERRLELEKTISLAQLDPQALMSLKSTGSCQFDLSEKDFSFDFPGHYCRQIKTLSISLPLILGPYQNVHATLTQMTNKIVTSDDTEGQTAVKNLMTPAGTSPSTENTALRLDVKSNQQVALSQGVNDSGLFELNFNDERYLPFEGTGAVSSWQLEMPLEDNSINFDSLSDVIIQLKYTALSGNIEFKNSVKKARGNYNGSHIFSLAQEFSAGWNDFIEQTPSSTSPSTLSFTIDASRWRRNMSAYSVSGLALYCEGKQADSLAKLTLTADDTTVSFSKWSKEGIAIGEVNNTPLTESNAISLSLPTQTWTLKGTKTIPDSVTNLILVVAFSATPPGSS